MTTKITIDSAGRIVIPKPVRRSLGLKAGDALEIDASADEITLRPVRETATLVKEQGIWVYMPDVSITNEDVTELMDGMREERARDYLR